MGSHNRNRSRSIWFLVLFVVWLIINIRVEAGIASVFERGLDGLVGGGVLLVSIFLALRFFGDKQGPWRARGRDDR
jgi:hypothetical protein